MRTTSFLLSLILLNSFGCEAPSAGSLAPKSAALQAPSNPNKQGLRNGDFAHGSFAGWIKVGSAVRASEAGAQLGHAHAETGSQTIQQSFKINEKDLTLSLMASFSAPYPQAGDYQRARLLDEEGDVLAVLFDETSNQPSRTKHSLDLSAYVGATVTLQIQVYATQTGFLPATSLRVDDVQLTHRPVALARNE